MRQLGYIKLSFCGNIYGGDTVNFEHLKYIIEVAEKGSISKAAHHLFVTQPYLSRIIKEVEKQLDIVLFIRSPQGIIPTPKGKIFIQKAKNILEQYKGLMDIETTKDESKPTFTVTTVRSSLVMETFLDLMEEYTDYEEYEFTFKETEGQTPIHDVTYYESDLGIIYIWDNVKKQLLSELDRQENLYEKICDFNINIILGVNHPLLKEQKPITIEQLTPYGMVTYEKQYLPYMFDYLPHDYLDEILDTDKIRKKIYVNNRAALHNILFHTNCFSIGTQAAKDQEKMFNITSVPLPKTDLTTVLEMGVLYRKNSEIHPIAEKFIQKLKQNYSSL